MSRLNVDSWTDCVGARVGALDIVGLADGTAEMVGFELGIEVGLNVGASEGILEIRKVVK